MKTKLLLWDGGHPNPVSSIAFISAETHFSTTYVLGTGPFPSQASVMIIKQEGHIYSLIQSFYSGTASTGKTEIVRLFN